MDEEDKERQEYHLSIQFDPWQAVLEPLAHTTPRNQEQFDSPLALLERLERQTQRRRGVK